MTDPRPRPTSFEVQYVHSVYEQIAGHFSHTRFKPWPRVSSFLETQCAPTTNSALPSPPRLLDVGCGNGKYAIFPGLDYVGVDTSPGLLEAGIQRLNALRRFRSRHPSSEPAPERASLSDEDIATALLFGGLAFIPAAAPPLTAFLVASALQLPFPEASFDCLICVAVVHHLSSSARRLAALREMLRVLKPGAAAVVTVWAREGAKGRKHCLQELAGSCSGDEPGDAMVPWTLDSERFPKARSVQPSKLQSTSSPSISARRFVQVQRYYHFFVRGELSALAAEAGFEVLEETLDCDNWYVQLRKP
jgi:tRNA (uracil-5-)-methyltransferase TRM9